MQLVVVNRYILELFPSKRVAGKSQKFLMEENNRNYILACKVA